MKLHQDWTDLGSRSTKNNQKNQQQHKHNLLIRQMQPWWIEGFTDASLSVWYFSAINQTPMLKLLDEDFVVVVTV